jgi:hypothetical protein
MAFLVLGIAIGASCASFRRRVATMLVLSAFLGAVAVLGGITVHAHPWVIAVQVLGSITALQFVYVAVGLTVHLVRLRKLIPHVQIAIGRRLRAELEVPRSVPPELSVLVARLPST